jgi:hypothetical protein
VLTEAQRIDLLQAAAAVDWRSVEPDYTDPENPLCCCDQVTYTLEVALSDAEGGRATASTRWCSHAYIERLLPAALFDFLDVLDRIGDEIVEAD